MIGTLIVSLVLCFASLACNQHTQNVMPDITYLYGHWIRSQEEDDLTQRFSTYRRETYAFPPSRGRDEFEIEENGNFVSHPIAPAEGSQTLRGQWKLDDDELTITGNTGRYRFRIVSLTRDKLVLQALPAK